MNGEGGRDPDTTPTRPPDDGGKGEAVPPPPSGDPGGSLIAIHLEKKKALWRWKPDREAAIRGLVGADLDGDDVADLLVKGGEFIHALRGSDAGTIWERETGLKVHFFCLARVDGDDCDDVVAGSSENPGILCLSGRDGSLLWQYKLPSGTGGLTNLRVPGTPCAGILAYCRDYSLHLLSADPATTGGILWSFSKGRQIEARGSRPSRENGGK